MRRVLVALLCSASALAAREQDWAKLVDQLTSHDRAVVEAAQSELADMLPRLGDGKPEWVTAEIPGLVAQLNRSDKDGARQLAAVLLMGMAQGRADSAIVLSGALPALIEHARNDPHPEVRRNSLLALATLNPGIPELAVEELLLAMDSPDQDLIPIADYGVARLVSTHQLGAAAALDKALSSGSSSRRVAAIKAIGEAHVADSQLVSHVGSLLADSNDEVVRAALEAIGKLGPPAIALNSVHISRLAQTSSNQEFVRLAHQLLDRQATGK